MSKSLDYNTLETLDELNEDLKLQNLKLSIVIIGGTLGVYHLGKQYRSTMDIDVLINNKEEEGHLKLLRKHGLDIPYVIEVPPQEEVAIQERTDDIIHLSNLIVFLPKIEILALYKLMTIRGKDFEDLQNYPILDKCNIEELQHMIDDYKNYLFNDHPDYNYKRFDELLETRNLI